ncbi:MAG: queuosine precursor transporter [Phycisphaerales bacterium]|nr:queuosine precursor transporter [Phycisphaerales bacterium]
MAVETTSTSRIAEAGAHPGQFDARTLLYLWISGVFVTCLLLANILGVKLFRFELNAFGSQIPIEHTVGMLTFPVTFVLTDLLNEYYGKRAARRATYVAFAMGVLAFILIMVARKAPILTGIPGTATQESFENIFGAAALMYVASMVAFLLGSLLDIFLFGFFKRLTGGKMVWLRATGSTVVSQLFDSFVITFVFFVVLQRVTGGEPASFLFVVKTALTGYVLKFVISVVLTPVIYLGRWMIRRYVGLTPLPATSSDA